MTKTHWIDIPAKTYLKQKLFCFIYWYIRKKCKLCDIIIIIYIVGIYLHLSLLCKLVNEVQSYVYFIFLLKTCIFIAVQKRLWNLDTILKFAGICVDDLYSFSVFCICRGVNADWLLLYHCMINNNLYS